MSWGVLFQTNDGWDVSLEERESDITPDAVQIRLFFGAQCLVWVRYVHPQCRAAIVESLKALAFEWRDGKRPLPDRARFE